MTDGTPEWMAKAACLGVDPDRRVCDVGDCERKHYCRGYCRKHYRAWAKWGDPLFVGSNARPGPRTTPEQFWARVDKNGPNGCWLWTGSLKPQGYGQLTWRGRKGWLAHRVALELVGIEVPKGWHTDHLCCNPPCVNPAHLEPVTCAENIRRAFERRRNAVL